MVFHLYDVVVAFKSSCSIILSFVLMRASCTIYLLVVSMLNQLYLILIDGNDDDGSQRDDDALPSKSVITASATTASPSSMIAMNEDVPSLVSCSVIVNHTLNPYITRVCCTILNRLMMTTMLVTILTITNSVCSSKINSLKVKPSITAHKTSEIDTMMIN